MGAIADFFPAGSGPAEFFEAMLDEGPVTERGEAGATADLHSAVFAGVGVLALFLATGALAAIDAAWGQVASRRAGAVLLAPTAFFLTLAAAVQLAKFRQRFIGAQPELGRASWVACVTVVCAVALIFALG